MVLLHSPTSTQALFCILLLMPQFLSTSAPLCHLLQVILQVLSHDAYSLSPATDSLTSVLITRALIFFTPNCLTAQKDGGLELRDDMLRPLRPCVTLTSLILSFFVLLFTYETVIILLPQTPECWDSMLYDLLYILYVGIIYYII